MQNIILKTPGFIFIVLVYGPLIYLVTNTYRFSADYAELLMYIPLITTTIWTLSLATYMSNEDGNYKKLPAIHILCILSFIFQVMDTVSLTSQLSSFNLTVVFSALVLANQIVLAFLLTTLIGNVLYARTKWFIFIEVFFPPIGIITLTPDVQEWEKSDKK